MVNLTAHRSPHDARPELRLWSTETSLSGDHLTARVHGWTEHLRRLGVRPGDRVLLRGDNSVAYVVVLLALMQSDVSIVVVDPLQTANETAQVIREAHIRWVVTDRPEAEQHPAVIDLTTAVALGRCGAPVDLDAWAHRTDAAILWSSGTTGKPKGVVKSGPSIMTNVRATIDVMGYGSSDMLAAWLPYSHQYGLSLVLIWYRVGCGLAIAPYRRLDQAVNDLVRCGATVVDATPSTYFSLLQLLERRPDALREASGVRMWCVGGAPLPRSVRDAFRQTIGRPLLDGYGMTELGNVCLAVGPGPQGCGRPLPDVEVRVRTATNQPATGPERPGEIEVRSPGRMVGYLGDDASAAPASTADWYRTNDLGYLDERGNLHVLGRLDAVHRHGYTLYPASIEARAESAGRPVRVVPLEGDRRGASLAFVIADPEGGTPKDWRRRLCSVLAPYEQPNVVHVVPEFPLNRNGKVDLECLRELVTA